MAGRLLGLLAIFGVGLALTALLTIAWMMVLTYSKKKAGDMDGEKWDAYFHELPTWGYVVRGLLFLALALWVTVPLVCAALRLFRYEFCGELSLCFGLVAFSAVVLRGVWKRKYLMERLQTLKN